MSMQTSDMRDFAAAAIGDKALAEKWLATPSDIFEGSSPLAAMASVDGYHQVMLQLAWFAGQPIGNPRTPTEGQETVADLLNDPIMDLVLRRAGTGPEEVLKLCKDAAFRHAA